MRIPSWRRIARPLRERLARRRWRTGATLATSGATWGVVALLFVAVTVVGHVGFTRYMQAHDAMEPVATRLYLALQLFVLESGSVTGDVPWELELARFGAPLVAAYAVLQALVAVFRDQVASLRLRVRRDHVVVAGLGRKGWLLTQSLLRRGDPVVVVEADPANGELETVRAVGGLVVVGDARSPVVLRRAGAHRAHRLVVLCGDDATNVEVVATARTLPRQRPEGLRCVAHLTDPQLSQLLSVEELTHDPTTEVHAEFVDVHAAATRALLRAHPPWSPGGEEEAVVVVGGAATARELVVALARTRGLGMSAAARPRVTAVGMEPAAMSAIAAQHPEVDRLLRLECVAGVEALPTDAIAASDPSLGPALYVCPDDDVAAVRAGLLLRRRLEGRPARIVVVLEQRSGLTHLVRRDPSAGGPTVATFGLLDEACDPQVLLAGTTELLARELHEIYLHEHRGGDAAVDPALRPWSELPASLRASNRDQAAHVGVKLAAVGRVLVPLTSWDVALRPFGDEEVELMARLEHDRWVAERTRAGWRTGPRDPDRHTTPYLVPWEELSEEVREYDRMFVHQLPRLLASAGLQAVPRDTTQELPALTAPRAP